MAKSIGYSNDYGDDRCIDCKGPTFLLSMRGVWAIDEEPIENGEHMDEIKDPELKRQALEIYHDGKELDTEITCHWCPKCNEITSLNVNW